MRIINVLSSLRLASAGLVSRQSAASYEGILLPAQDAYTTWALAYTQLGVTADAEHKDHMPARLNAITAEAALLSEMQSAANTIYKKPAFDETNFGVFIKGMPMFRDYFNLSVQAVEFTRPHLSPLEQKYTADILGRLTFLFQKLWETIEDKGDETQRTILNEYFWDMWYDIWRQRQGLARTDTDSESRVAAMGVPEPFGRFV